MWCLADVRIRCWATVVFYFWSVLGLLIGNEKKQVLFSFGGWLDAGQGCS
jgi:hypothetical protein